MIKTFSGRLDQFIASRAKAWTLPGFVLQSSMGKQTFERIPWQSSWRKRFKPTKRYFPDALRLANNGEHGRPFQKRSCPFFIVMSSPWNRHLFQRATKA